MRDELADPVAAIPQKQSTAEAARHTAATCAETRPETHGAAHPPPAAPCDPRAAACAWLGPPANGCPRRPSLDGAEPMARRGRGAFGAGQEGRGLRARAAPHVAAWSGP